MTDDLFHDLLEIKEFSYSYEEQQAIATRNEDVKKPEPSP